MAHHAVLSTATVSHHPRGWRRTAPRVLEFALEHLLVLPLGAVLALIWVNADPETYYRFTYGITFAVNDVGMVFVFGLFMKEIVEATIPGGVLHSWRRISLPVVAATGALIVPAAIFVGYVGRVDEPMLSIGWPVPGAIDLAIAYFVARLIFGRHAAVPFVLVLGIAATAFGFLFVAALFPSRDVHLVEGAASMLLALTVAGQFRRLRVKSFWPYLLVAGGLSWLAFYRAGIHTALALVPIVPFMPHAQRDPGFFVEARPGAHDALSQFERWWTHPVQVALFFFALVNAGVPLRGLESGAWAVPLAALVGKPLGILAAVGLGLAAGLHLPHRVGWRELTVIACIASVGFTMALFFTSAIMAPGQFLSETRMGVLLGLAGVPLAFLVARLLHVGRYARTS
jgi:NhaA family Na+:H+ antiporter